MSYYIFILKFHHVLPDIPLLSVYYLLSATYKSVVMNSFLIFLLCLKSFFQFKKLKFFCHSASPPLSLLVGSLFNDSALCVPSIIYTFEFCQNALQFASIFLIFNVNSWKVFPPAIYEVPCIQCILIFNAHSRNSGITFKVCSRRLYRTSCYLPSVLCLVSRMCVCVFFFVFVYDI